MKTLYELLGALPHDDAEELRTAFRHAVKGAHPDIHPDDPDAALKFRQIIRAHDILRDDDQRAAYDHLLELAEREQDAAARNVLATKIYKLGLGILALAGVSVASIASYAMLMQISTTSLPSVAVDQIDLLARGSAEIAAITLAGPWDLNDRATIASQEQPASATVAANRAPYVAIAQLPDEAESAPPLDPALRSDAAPFEALRAKGIAAYRKGDLDGAIAALDEAILLNPSYTAAYIDRGIVFYRMRKLDRALADIEKAKRIDRAGHSRPDTDSIRRPRLSQGGADSGLSQLSQQRMPGKQAARTDGVGLARIR
jgi:curved DNA-binding protein CbpA